MTASKQSHDGTARAHQVCADVHGKQNIKHDLVLSFRGIRTVYFLTISLNISIPKMFKIKEIYRIRTLLYIRFA